MSSEARQRRPADSGTSGKEEVSTGQAFAVQEARNPTEPLLLRVGRWLYRGEPDDPKMLKLWHPLVTCGISYAIFFVVLHLTERAILRSSWTSPIDAISCPPHLFESVEACREAGHWRHGGANGSGEDSQRLRSALGVFLVVYFTCILGLRTAALGWQNVYESLWGCNIGLMVGAASYFFNRPLWASATVFALAIDQILWYVDVLSYLIKRKFVIGVAAYLTWEETHWFKKITCAHHLWFTPLIAGMLFKYPPHPTNAFPMLSTVLLGLTVQWLLVTLPRTFLPAYALWPAETPLPPEEYAKAKKDEAGRALNMIYLNVNLSYGPWKDVKLLPGIFSPKWAHGAWWFTYLPYMNVPWAVTNAILCLPLFMFL